MLFFVVILNGRQYVSAATLFEEKFEDKNYASRSWYDNASQGNIASGGQSGNCMEWTFAKGQTAPNNGSSMRKKFTATDSLYVSYYLKFQSTWEGSQQSYHPHMFYVPSNLDSDYCSLADNYLNTYIEAVSDIGSPYNIRPTIAIQDNLRVNSTCTGSPPCNMTSTENRSVAYCNGCKTEADCGQGICYNDSGWYSSNYWTTTQYAIPKNQWSHIEVYFKMNSISSSVGQADGVMKMWIDGQNVFNKNNIIFRTNQDATKKWAQFVLGPYIGVGSPIAQTMWVDELKLSTDEPYTSTDTTPPAAPKNVVVN
jgi:hypothetical protein